MRSSLRSLINSFTWLDWGFLALACVLGAWVLLYATGVYGAGVSSDSMFYISSADSFIQGKGFFDFKGDALVDFPPLYPLVLGLLSRLTGATSFVLGRFLNILAMSLVILSTGLLVRLCFPERRAWLYLGMLVALLFLPLYTLGANIATDLIYILLSLWFCLAAAWFLKMPTYRGAAIMTILAAAAAFLRWVGLALVVTEFLVVLIAYRRQLKKAILAAAAFSGAAVLPVGLWVGVRNRAITGTLGRIQVETQKVDIFENLRISISRIIAWASPDLAATCLPLLAVLVLAILLLNRRNDWLRWLKRLTSHSILPSLILSGVYFFSTLAGGYTADRTLAYDDRYQAPLFFCLLILFFAVMDELVLAHLKGRAGKAVLAVVVGIFCLWGFFQVGLLSRFVHFARSDGVAEYNEYNNKQMVRSGLVVFLLKNPPPAGAALYSNEPEAVYFFLRRTVKMSPVDHSHYTAAPEMLTELYPKWPAEKSAYLIWFKPNVKRQYYSPDEVEKLATLEKLYKRWDGELYIAMPKE